MVGGLKLIMQSLPVATECAGAMVSISVKQSVTALHLTEDVWIIFGLPDGQTKRHRHQAVPPPLAVSALFDEEVGVHSVEAIGEVPGT